jgi:restriction endonuclease
LKRQRRGRSYELSTGALVSDLNQDKAVDINVRIMGRLSEVNREIDVKLEQSAYDFIAYECKDWNKTIDVPVVEAFNTKLLDVGAKQGAIVSNSPFSTAARNMAKKLGIDLLHLIDTNDPTIRITPYITMLTIDRQLRRARAGVSSPIVDQGGLPNSLDDAMILEADGEIGLKDNLRLLWNRGDVNKDPGMREHTIRGARIRASSGLFSADLTYTYLVEEVYKEGDVRLFQARGFYDPIHGTLRVIGELVTDVISVEDIAGSWRELSQEEAQERRYVLTTVMSSLYGDLSETP